MKRGKIFIIDDERTIRLTFRLALETDGYEVEEAAGVDEAQMGFKTEQYDLAVLDLRLGEESGLDFLQELRERGVQTPVLMITAYGSIRHAVRAMQLGAIDFLEKPIEPAALRLIVAEILVRHRSVPSALEPGSLEDLLREAKRLINLQGFEMAGRMVAEAIRLDDQSPDAHYLHGVLAEIRSDYEEARRAYDRTLALNPRYEAASRNLRRLEEIVASKLRLYSAHTR
jgi:DNA-binding response OmpR family regulator